MRFTNWMAFVALGSTLQAQTPDRLLAWLRDGFGLEIHSESTGSTRAISNGALGIGPGAASRDVLDRWVMDSSDNILFDYNLEAERNPSGTVRIRIEPISPKMEANLLERRAKGLEKFSGDRVPTVAAVRELSAVKFGEAVTLDILYNPSTGERIYDVIQPVQGPPPVPKPYPEMLTTAVKSRPEISLRDITIQVNGHAISAAPGWLVGTAVRIDIPGHGAYFAALYDQKDAPPILYAFKQIAQASGKKLRWSVDGDQIEIDSTTNVLTQAPSGVLWLYHDARVKSQDLKLQAGDTVDALMAKK